MGNAMVRQEQPMAAAIEQVIIQGNLAQLTPEQRVVYYHKVCESVGLNPFTRPFDYITLNGKLTLYAKRDAADQLRTIHGISLSNLNLKFEDDLIVATVEGVNQRGRTDGDMGVVSCKGLQGEAKANAMMKAITKAKRRVTLSLAGLGWLDETEVDTISGAQRVDVDAETGEIKNPPVFEVEENPFVEEPLVPLLTENQLKELHILGKEVYGKEAWATKGKELVEEVSKGAVSSSKQLTPDEADKLIADLRKEKAKAAAKAAKEKVTA